MIKCNYSYLCHVSDRNWYIQFEVFILHRWLWTSFNYLFIGVPLCYVFEFWIFYGVVGGSHAERAVPLRCYCLWNQGLNLSLFDIVIVVVILSSDFVFVYIIITSGLGLMYVWFFFGGRWFRVSMVSLPSWTRVVTSRRDQLNSELTRFSSPLMKPNSISLKLDKKRSCFNLRLAVTGKPNSFPTRQLMLRILLALLPSMYVDRFFFSLFDLFVV